MTGKTCTRAEDEQVLAMLTMRRKADCETIGQQFGWTGTAVRVATNRVINADRLEEGRDTRAEFRVIERNKAAVQAQGRRRA